MVLSNSIEMSLAFTTDELSLSQSLDNPLQASWGLPSITDLGASTCMTPTLGNSEANEYTNELRTATIESDFSELGSEQSMNSWAHGSYYPPQPSAIPLLTETPPPMAADQYGYQQAAQQHAYAGVVGYQPYHRAEPASQGQFLAPAPLKMAANPGMLAGAFNRQQGNIYAPQQPLKQEPSSLDDYAQYSDELLGEELQDVDAPVTLYHQPAGYYPTAYADGLEESDGEFDDDDDEDADGDDSYSESEEADDEESMMETSAGAPAPQASKNGRFNLHIDVTYIDPAVDPNTGKPTFVCQHEGCGQVFNDASNARAHTRSHTGEKPFHCDHPGCNASYGYSSLLADHKRSHKGDRPYVCDWPGCDSAFAQHSNLRRHKRIHTNEKPFVCDVCFVAFGQSSNLNAHLKRVHKIHRSADEQAQIREEMRKRVESNPSLVKERGAPAPAPKQKSPTPATKRSTGAGARASRSSPRRAR